jgi:hypothetical protein
VSPILGIIASQNYPRSTNSYESIATTTVGSGGASSVTFSSIPSTYQHLQLRLFTIGNGSITSSGFMALNGDSTSTNYFTHYLYGNGSSALAGSNQTNYEPFAMGTSSAPGVEILDFLDYKDTNKNKTIRTLTGVDANGSGQISLVSILWNNTAAINSISLSFTTIQQYSSFALYGIKG